MGPKIIYLKFYTRQDWKCSWKAENTPANTFPQNANIAVDKNVWSEAFAMSQTQEWQRVQAKHDLLLS